MPEILFVSAPYHCGVVEVAGRWAPLHFAYLADAAARAGVGSSPPAVRGTMPRERKERLP